MAINPSRIPQQFIEAARKKKREENQKKAEQDTKAVRGAFGSGGDKMDYQSSAPARNKVEEQKAKTDEVSKRGKASRARSYSTRTLNLGTGTSQAASKLFNQTVGASKRRQQQEQSKERTLGGRLNKPSTKIKTENPMSAPRANAPEKPKASGFNMDSASFSKAFAAARKEGLKVFPWRGKKYGTKLAKKSTKKQVGPRRQSGKF